MNPDRIVLTPVWRIASAAIAALAVIPGCSSSTPKAPESTSPASTPTATSPGSNPTTSTTSTAGSGAIAGVAFTTKSQFVQYERLSSTWRLHFFDATHTCADQLASIAPAIGVDLPAASAQAPPTTGTVSAAVTFIPPRPGNGPLTLADGVKLTLSTVDATPGGRWTGTLSVTPHDVAGRSFRLDTTINAIVCPPDVS